MFFGGPFIKKRSAGPVDARLVALVVWVCNRVLRTDILGKSVRRSSVFRRSEYRVPSTVY